MTEQEFDQQVWRRFRRDRVALASIAYQNEALTLQPCDVPNLTVWVLDFPDSASTAPAWFSSSTISCQRRLNFPEKRRTKNPWLAGCR